MFAKQSSTATRIQAIVTSFLNPTETKGARVKARSESGSMIIPWDHELSLHQNHEAACLALLQRKGWTGDYVGAILPFGKGEFVWVKTIDSSEDRGL